MIVHSDAVLQLHREFLRAGSDVMQAFTFYASDDKLENRGNYAGKKFTGAAINKAAADHCKKVAWGARRFSALSEPRPCYASGPLDTRGLPTPRTRRGCQSAVRRLRPVPGQGG